MAIPDPFAAVASIVGDTVTRAASTWVKASGIVVQSFRTMTDGMGLVKGVADAAFGGLQRLTGAINSTVAAYTQLFNPAATRLLEMAVRDLNASIGEALMPVLRIATAGIRAIADVIASMSPQAKQLVAALALATIASVAMTAAVTVMSAVMNTATAGIPALLAAVVGGVTSLVAIGKPLEQFKKLFQDFSNAIEKVFDLLGSSFAKVSEAAEPLFKLIIGLMASGIERVPGLVEPMIDAFRMLVASLIPAADAILPALLAVGQAVLNLNVLVVQVIVAALSPLLEVIGLILKPIGYMVQGLAVLANVFTGFVRLLLDGLVGAFRLLYAPIDAVVKLVQGIVGPAIDKFRTAVAGLWQSVQQVFGLIFDAIARIAQYLLAPIQLLGSLLGQVLIVHLQALAYVIETIATWITLLEDNIRRLFGIEKQEETSRVKPGSSVGKATIQASITSVDAYLDKARTASYGASRGEANNDPAMQTARHTKSMAEGFSEFNKNFNRFMETFANSPKSTTGGILAAGVSAVAPAMSAMALRQYMKWQG